jgi:hypothetical protein
MDSDGDLNWDYGIDRGFGAEYFCIGGTESESGFTGFEDLLD